MHTMSDKSIVFRVNWTSNILECIHILLLFIRILHNNIYKKKYMKACQIMNGDAQI